LVELGLREANQHFSRMVKIIKRGEEVILTERGRPIAMVTPLGAGANWGMKLDRLARAGLIRLPGKPGRIGPAKPVRARGKLVSQILSEAREER
jgi:prevent-host-death family protein